MRAASIPHLGQTTPTAAFGLRAILAPDSLDAGKRLTVRLPQVLFDSKPDILACLADGVAIQSQLPRNPRRVSCPSWNACKNMPLFYRHQKRQSRADYASSANNFVGSEMPRRGRAALNPCPRQHN